MRKINYGGVSFVTTDEIAEVLVQFTTAVAWKGTSAPVKIPAFEDGKPVLIELVIGPASEVISTPDSSPDVDDARSKAMVRELRRLIARLSSTRTSDPVTPAEARPLDDPLPKALDDLLA